MRWSPGVDVTMGFTVDDKVSVDLLVNRTQGAASLSIGREVAEITLAPCHLEMLRDRLPGVLADLGVIVKAYGRVEDAGARAEELGVDLRDRADAADAAGEPGRAGELRGMADQLKAAVAALDRAAGAVSEAAVATDSASEKPRHSWTSTSLGSSR